MNTLKNKYNEITFEKPQKKGLMSVIIPVYKDAAGLQDTLESLTKQTITKSSFEIIVGNDGHCPEVSDVCKQYKVQEVFTEKNQGSYTIRDLAIAASQGEYICFTDADIKVPGDWLKNILEGFTKGTDYIGGNVAIDKSKMKTLTNEYVSFYEFDNEPLFNAAHFTPTANVHVRRAVIEQLGAFDRRLFSSGDMEFGNRVYTSKLFKQTFQTNITVGHLPRGFHEFMRKLKRISGGERDLSKYYPERFKSFNKSIYRELREALYFPHLPATLRPVQKVRFTVLGIWFQLYRAFWNIKNRQ